MNPNSDPNSHPSAPAARQRFWQKFGAGSLSISIFLHLILLVAGIIWVFQVIPPPVEEPRIWTTTGSRSSSAGDKTSTHRRQQLAQSNLARVVALNVTSPIVVTKLADQTNMPSLPSLNDGGPLGGNKIGNSNGVFDGNKLGDGPGNIGSHSKRQFLPLPEVLGKRCSKQDRIARLKQNGGTEACEESVLNALRWLKANQNQDGSWGKETPAAMTGFALLAYFGHCETPTSEEFGDSCARGIVWLVNLGLKNDGKMAGNFNVNHWSYEHAIATYALGEASTFCKTNNKSDEIPYLTEITAKAGQYIIDHQNKNGGWAYSYAIEGGHTDLSVAGWQIQALKACDHTCIRFRGMKSCIDKALDYVNSCQSPEGGFGYNGPNKPPVGSGTPATC